MSGDCRHAFGGVPERVVHQDSSLVLPLMRPFIASSYFQIIPLDKEFAFAFDRTVPVFPESRVCPVSSRLFFYVHEDNEDTLIAKQNSRSQLLRIDWALWRQSL
jgi:hypothetical protein